MRDPGAPPGRILFPSARMVAYCLGDPQRMSGRVVCQQRGALFLCPGAEPAGAGDGQTAGDLDRAPLQEPLTPSRFLHHRRSDLARFAAPWRESTLFRALLAHAWVKAQPASVGCQQIPTLCVRHEAWRAKFPFSGSDRKDEGTKRQSATISPSPTGSPERHLPTLFSA
jgi:hypothetical protein